MHNIRRYLPELFNYPGVLLYVGARPDAHLWLDELLESGNNITVLEAWPKNAKGIWDIYRNINVITSDIKLLARSAKEMLSGHPGRYTLPVFDYIFWWHGPEHLLPSEIIDTLDKLEARTKRTIALACPWGVYLQGEHEGNPYEEHKTTLYASFFEDLGYDVATDGEPDKAGSEIVAWKRLNG